MTRDGAEEFYRRYIGCLNERRLGGLGEFVHEDLTYNGRPMTLGDYRELIEGGIAAMPDLRFDVHLVVADGERIAARLRFDCALAGEFLGLRPSGERRVSFAEHVFYRLRDGRIEEVWALIDRAAIEAQLVA